MSRAESKQRRVGSGSKRAPTKESTRVKRANESTGQSIARELRELAENIKAGVDLDKVYTVHRVRMAIEVPRYGPGDVKRVRNQMKLSQAVFAMFLGVDEDSVQSWEQGRREPSRVVRRFLEEIEASPRHWAARFKAKAKITRE